MTAIASSPITTQSLTIDDFSGAIQLDEDPPEHSSASLTIDAATIDTNTTDRDNRLRSADFFHVEAHPTVTFRRARASSARVPNSTMWSAR